MLKEQKLYALDDVTLIPAEISKINHRSECNIFDEDGNLPIFTAPMDMVINKDNYQIYSKNKIIPILPRTELKADRIYYMLNQEWVAFGLDEFYEIFVNGEFPKGDFNTIKVLIDIANGHIESLHEAITLAKVNAIKNNCKLIIMAGNVANPLTYERLAYAGADYVRVSVGSGQCCITSSNTSVHYPMASLISECYKLKCALHLNAKIVADGGINSYSRAIKALALGADYVMIGTTLAKCFESAGEFITVQTSQRDIIDGFSLSKFNDNRFNETFTEIGKKNFISKYHPTKIIYGMSTKRAQAKIAAAKGYEVVLKTSEGIERQIDVEYTLHQWAENFSDYLRSAMSYCNAHTLKALSERSTLCILSESAKNSINK